MMLFNLKTEYRILNLFKKNKSSISLSCFFSFCCWSFHLLVFINPNIPFRSFIPSTTWNNHLQSTFQENLIKFVLPPLIISRDYCMLYMMISVVDDQNMIFLSLGIVSLFWIWNNNTSFGELGWFYSVLSSL